MNDAYKYKALSNAQCIRLLRILPPVDISDPLQCYLEERSLTEEIKISGEPFWASPTPGGKRARRITLLARDRRSR
jgi:hypothetical protein